MKTILRCFVHFFRLITKSEQTIKVNKKEESLNLFPFEKAHLSARGITLILQRKHKK
jgi:hypothetical protein